MAAGLFRNHPAYTMSHNTHPILPSVGRIVHFVLPNGEHRPAIITRVWDSEPRPGSLAQLQVFVDGSNDAGQLTPHEALSVAGPYPTTVWRTSVHQDWENLAPGTWHAPERVEPAGSGIQPM